MKYTDITFHGGTKSDTGSIEYYSINELEKTGRVKAIFTSAKNSAWKFGTDGADENFKKLSGILGIPQDSICTTFQTHTSNVLVMKNENRGEGVVRQTSAKDYDGIVTNEKRLLLCSFEADCVPVYFFDPRKNVIAMVHSGWRGTAKEIVRNAVSIMQEKFNSLARDVIAVTGPCACKNCYEVGSDLISEFEVNFKNDIDRLFIPCRQDKEKYNLDMISAIELSLLRCGLLSENIFSVNKCTIEAENLCSFRRTKSKVCHILTAIMICDDEKTV
ncbi:MAG: peptidoglycan editing factor PgeF [Treponema sp.]